MSTSPLVIPNPGQVVPTGSLVTPSGSMGPTGPTSKSADPGNLLSFGSDGLISLPSSTIWGQRLRSLNAVGNPNFEVDQRQCGTSVAMSTAFVDRWLCVKAGLTGTPGTMQQMPASLPDLCIPGTSFRISRAFLRITQTGVTASLASGDQLYLHQEIEGSNWRELSMDVHSLSLLVRSSVAGLKFGVVLRDPPTPSQSLSKLCTIPNANTWTLIQLPNLPVWPSGNWQPSPGNYGYRISICLSQGSGSMTPANDTWQSGNFLGAVGQSNFCGAPVNSTFDVGFVQHEPGPVCTQLMDLDFDINLRRCKRYFAKSVAYVNPFPTTGDWRVLGIQTGGTVSIRGLTAWEVEMAKVPTVTVADNAVALNKIYMDAGGSLAVSAVQGITTRGFQGIALSASANSAGQYIPAIGQWTADTGW